MVLGLGQSFSTRALELLQSFQHLFHGRTTPGLLCKAIESKLGYLVCSGQGILPLEVGIHEALQLSLAEQIRLHPFNQILLTTGTASVKCPEPGQHLDQHNSKSENIALDIQMACITEEANLVSSVLSTLCSESSSITLLCETQDYLLRRIQEPHSRKCP